ncbi:MAG: hypothetical protein U9N49_01145 [Campylobacterota bacterium]|nr:hypothetical protein [Campylobacterota bacterium]
MSKQSKDREQESNRAWIEARKSKTQKEHRRELKSQNSKEEKQATKKAKEQVKKENIPFDKIKDIKVNAKNQDRESIYQKIADSYERQK